MTFIGRLSQCDNFMTKHECPSTYYAALSVVLFYSVVSHLFFVLCCRVVLYQHLLVNKDLDNELMQKTSADDESDATITASEVTS